MKYFNRIYWRIFFAFWSAIIVITFMTAYIVINKLQTADFIQRHQNMVSYIATEIIKQYEAGEPLPIRGKPFRMRQLEHSPFSQRSLEGIPTNNRPKSLPPRFNITDQYGSEIFQHRFKTKPNDAVLTFTLTGDSGDIYHVQTFKPQLPKFFKIAITRFFSLHLVLIIIVSALVSAILSWSLTRPLKALGQFSRNYAQGNKPKTHITKKLLARGDEIGDLAIDMYFMTQQIESTLAAQQQLLHDVSHELRAPLARLQASTALIEQSSNDTQFTNRIHSECDRINSLIQQILDYSRLNRETENRSSVNINTLLKELIDNLKFEQPNRHFIFSKPENPVKLSALPNTLASALDNILRNACKYSPEKSPVEITITEGSKILSITIRDHGEGVNDVEIEKLLQPFYRSGNKMHTEGFGLGLSIAKQAMDKHHGLLLLSNHAEGGLVVECQLPIA